MDNINFAGARHTNDSNVRRILESHRTCQVRSGIPSEIAAKRDNDGLEVFAHNVLSNVTKMTLDE